MLLALWHDRAMPFPPDPIAADKAPGAPSSNTEHPDHHNEMATAINDIVDHLTALGGYTFVQAESVSGEPVNPSVGDTWFDPENGNTYLRYNDGTSTVWMQSGTSTGGGAGSGGAGTPYYVIAANNAPAEVKAKADETVDGIADDVQIQAALDAGKPVLLSEGIFQITAPIQMPSLGILKGVGWKTTLRATAFTTGDRAIIAAKNNSAVAAWVSDLSLDGAYNSVHGIYWYTTSQASIDPPAVGSDNYTTFQNLFIDACHDGVTANSYNGIYIGDNPDGARSCNVFNIMIRQCGRGMHIESSDNVIANIHGNSEGEGLRVQGQNNRFTNIKFFFCDDIGLYVMSGASRNTFSVVEIQDNDNGPAFRIYGHETTMSACFVNTVSANRATTTGYDIWCDGSTFSAMNIQFSTGSGRTINEGIDFNTSNNISWTGTIGNPAADFTTAEISGTAGTGSLVAIARVGTTPYLVGYGAA